MNWSEARALGRAHTACKVAAELARAGCRQGVLDAVVEVIDTRAGTIRRELADPRPLDPLRRRRL